MRWTFLLLLLPTLGPSLCPVTAAATVVSGDRHRYELDAGRELALVLGGGAVLGASYWLQARLEPLEDEQIAEIEGSGLEGGFLGIDASARRLWSPNASRMSDVTLRLTQLGPVVQAVGGQGGEDPGRLLLMYGETVLLTSAANQLLKVLTHRPRPYVHNPDPAIPPQMKRELDARRSFPSGHAAASFAAAVHFSMVYERLDSNPDMGVIWGASLGMATLTACLRYAAGKHHPSDLVAGAVLGSLVGWLIPTLHENEESYTPAWSPTLSFGFSF